MSKSLSRCTFRFSPWILAFLAGTFGFAAISYLAIAPDVPVYGAPLKGLPSMSRPMEQRGMEKLMITGPSKQLLMQRVQVEAVMLSYRRVFIR